MAAAVLERKHAQAPQNLTLFAYNCGEPGDHPTSGKRRFSRENTVSGASLSGRSWFLA